MEEGVKKIVIKKTKKKTWGDNGFVGKVFYGCYDYEIKFIPKNEIKIKVKAQDDSTIYGAIDQFEQIIYVASDSSSQCQKATALHEIIHAIFLQNGSSYMGEDGLNISSEELVDRTANGVFEIMRRNPEIMRWLTK